MNDWLRHINRLEKLAKPRVKIQIRENIKSEGVPLKSLLPRITALAQPKYFTPKYVKKSEKIYLTTMPGKIQDWKA